MAHLVTDRLVVGLYWAAGILSALAVLSVTAIGWTTTSDSLLTAVSIAALAFGLPALGTCALAYYLDDQVESLEGRHQEPRPIPRHESARHPFRELVLAYVVAVGSALAAWGIRALIDPILPGSTLFLTFFIAVAVSGWLGGYGPALVTTAISGSIALYFYIPPTQSFLLLNPMEAVKFGSFVFICLLIGGLSAALCAALRQVQSLVNELSGHKPTTNAQADAAPLEPRLGSASVQNERLQQPTS